QFLADHAVARAHVEHAQVLRVLRAIAEHVVEQADHALRRGALELASEDRLVQTGHGEDLVVVEEPDPPPLAVVLELAPLRGLVERSGRRESELERGLLSRRAVVWRFAQLLHAFGLLARKRK